MRFDTGELVESTMQHLDWFMPPQGRVLLGYADQNLAGIACLKELAPGMGEVKRMYVRPAARMQGLDRALLERLLQESNWIGYNRVRLDSARFMREAHALYHNTGFREIDAYEGSEIPLKFQKHWVFMEKEMTTTEGVGGEKDVRAHELASPVHDRMRGNASRSSCTQRAPVRGYTNFSAG